ncbi:MAG: hypothetical protein JWN30_310 [Bacilli bacterium]|nr:hypothetical protein [Bacilli bacterium]
MAELRVVEQPAIYAPPLVQNLLRDFPLVDQFYEYDPTQAASYVQRAQYLEQHWSGERSTLVEELVRYNRTIGADESAIAGAEALVDPRAVVLITGQQAGVATGPLYTIHKAITVIVKARLESQRQGRPVIPVFWVAAEDHDWQEVQSISVLTKEGGVAKVSLPFAPTVKSSVGQVAVPEEIVQAFLSEVREHMQETEFKEDLLKSLWNAWQRTSNMADWYAAFLAQIFQGTGLVFVNPTSRVMRSLVSERFVELILDNARFRKAVETGTEKLKEAGYPVQVELMQNSALLFLEYQGARVALEADQAGAFTLRGEGVVLTKQELVEIARREPTRLSPNVLIRPLIQDTIFPTLGYVGGPAEISYHAMIKDVFEAAEEQMSILIPRIHLTLVEKAQDRILQKYHFKPRDFLARSPKPVDQVLKSADQIGVDDQFDKLRQEFDEKIEHLTKLLEEIDPGVTPFGKEAVSGVNHRLEQFHSKAKQLFRKRHDTIIKQFERVESALAPHGDLQERELNVLSFLVKYGPNLVRDLMQVIPEQAFGKMLDIYL